MKFHHHTFSSKLINILSNFYLVQNYQLLYYNIPFSYTGHSFHSDQLKIPSLAPILLLILMKSQMKSLYNNFIF